MNEVTSQRLLSLVSSVVLLNVFSCVPRMSADILGTS